MDYLSQKLNNEQKKSNLNARPSWCRKPGSPNSVSSLSELHNMMRKTKYCNLGNRCTRRNCDFAHNSRELRRSNVTKMSYKTVLCKNYWRMVDGKPVKTCPYIHCGYVHEDIGKLRVNTMDKNYKTVRCRLADDVCPYHKVKQCSYLHGDDLLTPQFLEMNIN